jgi:hypothetical protein
VADLQRIVTFSPACDKRDPNPSKNYGIHGVDLRFVLKGEKGAVQFVLYTMWQLPHVTKENASRRYEAVGGDSHWMERPTPADLGYHSLAPHYEGQTVIQESCEFLDGRPCYYDGSSLNAEPVYHRLLAEGDAGVWSALEDYYRRVFEEVA